MVLVVTLFRRGMTETDLRVGKFRAECERAKGSEPVPWYLSYRVPIGIV